MGTSHRVDRHQSASPPYQPQQLSKRDKRRITVGNKLQDLIGDFTANRDSHYRSQLQALQIDANLVQEALANSNEGLPNGAEQVEALVRENMLKTHMKSVGSEPPQRAGRHYAEFAKDVNDRLEQRDADLSTHMASVPFPHAHIILLTESQRDYKVKKAEITAHHAYKRRLAELEHESLSNTLRDRLTNSLMNKRARLMTEKESNEISDTPAYFLHPSQFALANPSSPGGIHGKRATRHRREADEVPNFPESHKRKRKAHDSDESPAPTRQRIENGTHTPGWTAERTRLLDTQVNSPLYSIDKLFTEKELSMTYNTAALAAYSYMHRNYADAVESPPNGKSESTSENDKATGADHDGDDADSPPVGADMARQVSHATRSTRQNFGIETLHGIENPGVIQALTRQIPKLPQMINTIAGRAFAGKNESVVPLSGLSADDVNAEMEAIRRARAINDEKGPGSNLKDEATRSMLERSFSHRREEDQISYLVHNKASAVTPSNARDELVGLGGVPMSQQNSQGVASSLGGTAMSRQGTNDSMKKGRKSRAS
jgi:hypothetical protein